MMTGGIAHKEAPQAPPTRLPEDTPAAHRPPPPEHVC